ncbi:MAG: hypothetical protein J07HN6_00937 [Halonotius sp. J07HN6]|jgi:hypothetical protein|nr:MAG: hypothetical protein J07HN6_00937 [Halonotius sp. J07HN6]ESS09928.1 MAG: hypothetical protein A07HN63_00364 [uncultured archaeon A07HN63]
MDSLDIAGLAMMILIYIAIGFTTGLTVFL